MVILHGGIKTIQIGIFPKKKERNIVSFWKTPGFSKKTGGLGLKKTAVSQPCV